MSLEDMDKAWDQFVKAFKANNNQYGKDLAVADSARDYWDASADYLDRHYDALKDLWDQTKDALDDSDD